MDSIEELLKQQFHERVIEESLARICQCLDTLTHDEIWYKHNSNTNSVGNLVLHLSGNVKQYIIAGLGGMQDTRDRESEFLSTHNYPKEELKEKITTILTEANLVVRNIPNHDFAKKITIQGFRHNYVSTIVHVIEHLSYHVGQITYYTKFIKDMDTGYYEGMDLDITE